MLRNREIQMLLIVMCSINLLATIVGAFLSLYCGVLLFLTCLLLTGYCLYFTRQRYREIEKLSGYLRQISAGDHSLDIRDNQEGELSILKNEIYKVTQMLIEQGTLLKKEKNLLRDAISDITHQIKTPLTSLRVMTDLLNDGNLPEDKRQEFTRNTHIQLERMQWLVSSLLKM